MFYLGIDQHSKQFTISLRDEDGDVIQRRQVSTRPEKVETFLQELSKAADPYGGRHHEGMDGGAIGSGT